MLKKGIIPKKEPIISIGLVLPIDKQHSIKIKCNSKSEQYCIEIMEDHLHVNGNRENTFSLEKLSNDSSYNLDPICAGRGFHWQKKISISVQGCLRIENVNGYLFVVNDIGLESYLMSVATSEMSGDCPIAMLEAQTIAARSWLIASEEQKHSELGLDACNDDCCQRYQGIKNMTKEAESAARGTRGTFITYENEICDARYSKSCGGITENNENVWNNAPKAYLRGIYDGENNRRIDLSNAIDIKNWLSEVHECYCSNDHVDQNELNRYLGSVDEKGNYFRWEFTYSKDQLKDIINKKMNASFDSVDSLTSKRRGVSGRILKLMISGTKDDDPCELVINNEYDIRDALHPEFLYSSAFTINANSNIKSDEDKITLTGAGWGHGVGLCQIGALGMALSGRSSEEILRHYFSSITIKKLYD